ncbi:MAG: UDP-N-acetylmuramoyl-L-alanyl-D-glutamate--2,6-diaminopimelate ligase [Prevotellaceae bacterium]|jgi:UDP-N-acetylmuramoyl-L-alanyl-D-glutamate--2,6-diaminopimelate ligase|nr:UDP-N-acetylmuramoyl-L-alanyl-D-glutamate--2,6-diaminopimelate ligase [Prevotellaceae bacterium]
MKTLQNIIKNLKIKALTGDADVEISGVEFDSRKIKDGNMFVATRGLAVDGHSYIPMAIEKGAKAIVCEEVPASLSVVSQRLSVIVVENSAEALGLIACQWYNQPSENLILTGVTGTNGKTTTATLLYEIFRKLGYKAGLISTVCNYIDSKPVPTNYTTPDPLELNALLAEMVAAGCQYAFMEVSSHSVEQHRIAGLHFKGAIFTNLTHDHIDYHLTFENYLKAKKRFFDDLPADAFALTNADDRNGMVMLQNTKAAKYTYSLRTAANFKTKILEHDFNGMLLEINGKEVHVQFIGRFNASNLTDIYGAATLLIGRDKLPVSDIELLQIISALHSVSGRFETIRAPQGYTAIVDYAHTPDALQNVISTINDILQNTGGDLITVVGCGGDRDRSKRPVMAREAVDGSAKAILTSDNPRNEDPQEILNDMLAGLDRGQKQRTLVIADRREAIKTACSFAKKGDVVLIAGKGHEDYQIVKGVKHHFDDREEVKTIISY